MATYGPDNWCREWPEPHQHHRRNHAGELEQNDAGQLHHHGTMSAGEPASPAGGRRGSNGAEGPELTVSILA
jgi:hypothetical protein